MRASSRLYCRIFAGVAFAGLTGVAAFNLLVDPVGAYPWFAVKNIEPYRPQITSRAAKSEMLLRHPVDVLLLGSSRIQAGIPVRHPAYGTTRVFNLGLNGTTLIETAAVLDLALQRQRPKRVLLGADFLMFSDLRGWNAGFKNSRFNPELEPLEYHFTNILGADTLNDSGLLLRQWLRGNPPPPSERGFDPRTLRPGTSQRGVFANNVRDFVVHHYGVYHYSLDHLEVFRQIIRQCRDAGVELVVFIPPVHALQLETIRAARLWPIFEHWKGDLVRIVAEEGVVEAVPLWDFTGYTGRVAETVPPAGDTTTRMKWYVEGSHFTPALGEEVLNRLLTAGTEQHLPPDFGVRLTTNNLAAQLSRIRADRETYAAAHADEIAWVTQIAVASKGGAMTTESEF